MRHLVLATTLLMIAAAPAPATITHWYGSVAGHRIDWTPKDISVFDAKGRFSYRDYLARRNELATLAGTATADVKLLAAAGDYLSVSERWDTFFGTYNQVYADYVTLDLRTRKAAKLTDLFPKADVRAALLADPVVRGVMREKGAAKPAATLEGLLEQVAGATVYGDKTKDPLNSAQLYGLDKFALHSAANGKAGVRVVLDQPGGIHHALPVVLGLTMPIPAKLRDAFAKAASGREGVLMDRAARIPKTTTFDFTPIMQKLPR